MERKQPKQKKLPFFKKIERDAENICQIISIEKKAMEDVEKQVEKIMEDAGDKCKIDTDKSESK